MHQASGIPWAVIVDDDIGTVQVDTLCQHIACDDDVIVIALLLFVVGIKVGLDVLFLAVAIASANRKDVGTVQSFLKFVSQIVHRIHTLTEDHQLAGSVSLGAEQLALQHIYKEVKFRVVMDGIPPFTQTFEQFGIILQHGQEIGQEISCAKHNLFLVVAFAKCQFNDFVQFHPIGLQLLHVQVGCDDDLVFGEHLNHPLGGFKQGVKRFFESIKAAFQSLHHVCLINRSQ